jgi:L-threonylcarbamoyladenylate synthase
MGNLSPNIALQVERAIGILRDGGLAAFPTDTVYGLGGDVFNVAAVEKIYSVKRRARNLPLPVLVAEQAQVNDVVRSVPEIARFLMGRFWPGGLTLVMSKRSSLPDIVTGGADTVGVRIPKHDIPLMIIRGLRSPIIGTSANISDKPSPVTAEEVRKQLGKQVDIIIDVGKSPGGLESTVVDVVGEMVQILRDGIIPADEIKKACREYAREAGKHAYCFGL